MRKLWALGLGIFLAMSAHAEIFPDHVVLIDTGYDACLQQGGHYCERNQNLLFRGSVPLSPGKLNFDPAAFRRALWQAILRFRAMHTSHAPLPNSLAALDQDRIVMINLINGYSMELAGRAGDRRELVQEFQDSGNGRGLPEQHYLYGLDTPFDQDHFAFEWWPVTLPKVGLFAPTATTAILNWPNQAGTPPHDYLPTEYLPMDLSYLIDGQLFSKEDHELHAKSLANLLKTMPKDGHPLLIFYHCISGEDRTGAVTMAYYMSQGGYSGNPSVQKTPRSPPMLLQDAFEATALPHLAPNSRGRMIALMYCQFLNRQEQPCDILPMHWWEK